LGVQSESRIEIWKSKPAWLAKPSDERKRIFENFACAVRAEQFQTAQAEGGPFLVEKEAGHLLIWNAETNRITVQTQDVVDLLQYFEPLLFVTLNHRLTIKALVAKLLA
jgi:hypothetical protein